MHFTNVCVYSNAARTAISRPVVMENSGIKRWLWNSGVRYHSSHWKWLLVCVPVCWQTFPVILGEDFRGSTGRIRLSASVVQSAFAVLVTPNRKRDAERRLSWQETAAASLAATEWLSSGFVSAAALLSSHSRWVWEHGWQIGWPSFVHSCCVWCKSGHEMCPTTGSVG